MKILITGSSGFIGKNLAEGLSSEYNVLAPNSMELDLLNAARVESYLKSHKVEFVLHCATWDATKYSTKCPKAVFENNLLMFDNLARNSSLYKRMFSLGSGAEYSKPLKFSLINESQMPDKAPDDDYGRSKYIINSKIKDIGNVYNLRLFGVYGKYEDWRIRFISNSICKALHGLDIIINQDVMFDYLYIGDLLKIIKMFLSKESLNFTDYNVCTASPKLLSHYAEIIRRKIDLNLGIFHKTKETGAEYSGSNNRLLREFKINFSDTSQSIDSLISYYKKNIKIIDKKIISHT